MATEHPLCVDRPKTEDRLEPLSQSCKCTSVVDMIAVGEICRPRLLALLGSSWSPIATQAQPSQAPLAKLTQNAIELALVEESKAFTCA